jgi:hypothetical protein
MAFSYEQILQSQYARIDDETAQQVAELEAGRVSEDAYRTSAAADRILELDKTREALERRAQGFVASQQRPQSNEFGLSKDEQDIAHGIASNDPRLSKQDRERTYAENKHKLRLARANGSYRDDQGVVSR